MTVNTHFFFFWPNGHLDFPWHKDDNYWFWVKGHRKWFQGCNMLLSLDLQEGDPYWLGWKGQRPHELNIKKMISHTPRISKVLSCPLFFPVRVIYSSKNFLTLADWDEWVVFLVSGVNSTSCFKWIFICQCVKSTDSLRFGG